MKETVKQILVRSIGLTLATAFGGTAIGAIAGDWLFGTVVGILSSFAVVATMIGVSVAWSGELTEQSVTNAFRAAVSKAAEDNEKLKDALQVNKDGDLSEVFIEEFYVGFEIGENKWLIVDEGTEDGEI
jgi:divalent metal cation (Fe/Co/Zn/Cd) transporter